MPSIEKKITSLPGILDKFQNNRLKPYECLNKTDLESGISTLELGSFDIQIVPFHAEEIGTALHLAREKHKSDTEPYTIPLIFDLGEDEHSRIHSRGSHWTKAIIRVTPTTPPELWVTYEDPLELPEASKKKIKDVLTKALRYNKAAESLRDSTMKTLTAFPACENPIITINGAKKPQESYTSGYTTLINLVGDLINQPIDLNGDTPRDFIYRTLIDDDKIDAKLNSFKALEVSQKAEKELQDTLLSLPDTPTRTFEKPKKFELSDLLKFMANNKNMFESFYYDELMLSNPSEEELKCLKEHLNRDDYTPFKAFALTFNTSVNDNFEQITSLLEALHKKNIDTLTLSFTKTPITIELVNKITEFVRDKGITTLLILNPKVPKIENMILNNRRTSAVANEAPTPTNKETILLGPIGKAIFQNNDMSALSAEVQVQQEQQQQVQQQMQSSIVADDLPDEDPIVEESFLTYSGAEVLIDRDEFNKTMGKFVTERHPDLNPLQCWDLITGEGANSFKYGIHKMSVSAAKLLVENLIDVQYGLHPDNLPRGFFLAEDADKNVVLAYDGINPPINPKESPFTLQFTKPKLQNNWVGDATQFITEEEAIELYKTIYEPNRLTTKETIKKNTSKAISNFFDLRNPVTNLSTDQQLTILEKFAKSPGLKLKIETLFDKSLSKQNIAALSEILYEQSASALSEFLDDLEQLKRAKKNLKDENFFESFKSCFIDSSQNLNELTTPESKTALLALQTQSSAESTWWVSLTEQHTSNLKYNEIANSTDEEFDVIEKPIKPGQRFASLAELHHCFNHFCAQLIETNPPLTLTEFCPLINVADMRVGLDRLASTILPNAHNVNEQFYQALDALELDPLGAFYASRYEGFKLVSKEMAFENPLKKIDAHEKVFRVDKTSFFMKLIELESEYATKKHLLDEQLRHQEILSLIESIESIETIEANIQAVFLKYVATFNHRAPLSTYKYALKVKYPTSESPSLKPYAQTIIATLSTGRRGKNVDKKEIDALAELAQTNYEAALQILPTFAVFALFPIKPTLSEVLAISNFILKQEPPKLTCLSTIYKIIEKYDKNADPFLSALVTLTRSKNPLPLDALLNALNSVPSEKISLNDQAEMSAVLVICRPDETINEDIKKKVEKLFNLIAKAPAKADIIELLKNIDVEQSAELPTLDELTQLVTDIIANQPTSYNDLVEAIKAKLPKGCIINTTAALTAPPQPTGNLHAILSKQMGTLITELEKQKSFLGDDFLEKLKTADGPAFLISELNELKNMPGGFINDAMKRQLINFILPLYDSVIRSGIDFIGTKGQNVNLLDNLINKQIAHPLKKENDFNAFIDLFTQELTNIENLTTHLRTLNQNWPTDFGAILQQMSQCSEIGMYPLKLLASITQGFSKGFDTNKPFPIDAFHEFFSYTPLNTAAQSNIQTIVDTLFNPEEDSSEASLSNDEKQQLSIIAVQCSKNENFTIAASLNEILSLKMNQPELFTRKLQLIRAKPDSFKDIINAIQSITSPDLSFRVLTFFSDDHAHDFLGIMRSINAINPSEKRPEILNILIKATQKDDYNLELLESNIELLKKLESIKPLTDLYAGSIYPNLKDLKSNLERPPLDLDNLQKKYDRDPFGLRDNSAYLNAQFDTKDTATLIDKMRDINHDRPLLYTQRKTLQEQFLYINAIGNDRPILTANNEQKAIKDLSHAEIKALLDSFGKRASKETKDKLEVIAILREVMYRATGLFPRATQILYLLSTLQNKGNFVAQIPTGQGKSLTSAMAAAMISLEGKTVDITSSNLFLASEGLNENQTFFDYLAIPTALINAESSKKDDYKTSGINYSSMSDIALYRSKTMLQGMHFSKENSVLIADEIDFSTLDDNTRYRFAKSLDTPIDPDKSPYTWAYEALIRFTDTAQLSDESTLLSKAKEYLKTSAKSKEQKTQLKSLEDNPEVYTERMKTWLIAAGQTKQLAERYQETKFRIISLEHKRKGEVSKACILTSGRVNIQAEFSNAVQQFLHVRLREQYSAEIKAGKMPDFLVEPEKIYVSTLNSKILMSSYQKVIGMTGTAGSAKEIKEQHEKYGFNFVDIPPHVASKRTYLAPILSNDNYLIKRKDSPKTQEKKREQSASDHIEKIVDEIIRHIKTAKPPETCSPMLITCADKTQGEGIKIKLQEKLGTTTFIQGYFGSEKPTSIERNKEENDIKKRAGKNGAITISNVFGRGTDIKPEHQEGLYTLKTYVDTQPHSVEDLERAKRQELGRSARGENKGQTRMVIDRNQFAEIPNLEIKETNESLDHAIQVLNDKRNTERVRERELRESFDDVKEIIDKAFRPFIKTINESDKTGLEKSGIRDTLLQIKSKLLKDIDNEWERLQHQTTRIDKLKEIAEFACKEWDALQNPLSNLLTTNKINKPTSTSEQLDSDKIVTEIRKRHAPISRHYVKQELLDRPLDQTLSSDDVYSEMASLDQCETENLSKLKTKKFNSFINRFAENFNTPAHHEKLKSKSKFTLTEIVPLLTGEITSENKINFGKNITRLLDALLYMRYKAYRDDNKLAYAELSRQCHELINAITHNKDESFIEALTTAQQEHFTRLIDHQGKKENKKTDYLRILSAEFNQKIGAKNDEKKKELLDTNLATIKETFKTALTAYRNNAWFVSNDRKTIAKKLIEELGKKDIPAITLLKTLSEYRQQILKDDLTHKRPISAGLSGRLNKTIDALRTQIIAASDSETVDSFVENEFDDINNCLKAFKERLNYAPLQAAIEALNTKNLDITMKYQALSRLFTETETFAANPKRTKDPSIDALALYCKNKQTELVYYFKQCNKKEYQSISHQESIAVFRVASQAGTIFSNAMATPLQPTAAQSKTIQYSGQNIKLTITPSLLNWHPNFKRINTNSMYQQLLSKIETTYVEQHNTDSIVRFLSVSLEKSEKSKDNVLQVIIDLTVDNKPCHVSYLIDLDKRLIYTDTQITQNKISMPDDVQTELEKSKTEINELATKTDNEIESITATNAFREKLRTGRDGQNKTSMEQREKKPLFPIPIKNIK